MFAQRTTFGRAAAAVFATMISFCSAQGSWPDTPFTVSGRDIMSASGANVLYAGVNWPGAADTMLPEGLQYNSIANITSMIKSLGMNVIRLTYAIEMVDDIFSDSPNQTLQNTLINALGQENGTTILQSILNNNPQFTADSTRLDVFDAIAEECANQQIWVHLDNHVSKAEWCCSLTDGNSWYGDKYFDVDNWIRGLGYMANHTQAWTALASMSLRNEPRPALDIPNSAEPYTFDDMAGHIETATGVINSNNSLPVILISGLNGDYDVSGLAMGTAVDSSGNPFKLSSFSYADKLAFEIHNYENSATSCLELTPVLYAGGYAAMDLNNALYPNHAPVVMTEFGFDQTDGSDEGVYAQCIKNWLTTQQPGGPAGWMQWTVSGSYYIRTGVQDSDDSYGLLNHDWSAWRNQTVIDEYVTPFVQATLG